MPALLTAQSCTDQVHLVIGSTALSLNRVSKSIEAGAAVVVIAPASKNGSTTSIAWENEIRSKVNSLDGKLTWVEREFADEDLTTLGREKVEYVADMVFVTLPKFCSQGTLMFLEFIEQVSFN